MLQKNQERLNEKLLQEYHLMEEENNVDEHSEQPVPKNSEDSIEIEYSREMLQQS